MAERQKKIGIVCLFLAMVILGLFIADDFTPHVDSFIQRQHSLVNYEYINRVLFNRTIPKLEAMIPSTLEDYPENYRAYGVFLQLPLVALEDATGFALPIYQVYWIRMLYCYLIFVVGLLCLYFMMKDLFGSRLWAVIGVLLIYTFPLYFNAAFTNIKDLLFASLFMISSYFMMRLLRKHSFLNFLLFSIFSAVTTGIRVIGILLPCATVCMLLYEAVYQFYAAPRVERHIRGSALRQTIGLCVSLAVLFLLALYVVTPAAWEDPFRHFINVLGYANDYTWDDTLKYQGFLLKWEDIPHRYLLRMMRITIPVFVGISFFWGVAVIAKKVWFGHGFFRKVYEHRYIGLQLLLFMIPVAYQVLLHVKIYDGWRHMYFVYVPLVVVATYGLMELSTWLQRFRFRLVRSSAILCSALCIAVNGYHTASTHPYQDNTFNYPSNALAADYLAAGRSALPDAARYLLEHFPGKDALWVGYPQKYRAMLTADENKRIDNPENGENPDFILEYYRYQAAFYAPIEGYSIYHSIEVDGYPILTIYMRNGYQ